jgi:hypothetical protein
MGRGAMPGPFDSVTIIDALRGGDRPWLVVGIIAVLLFLLVIWWSRRQAGG